MIRRRQATAPQWRETSLLVVESRSKKKKQSAIVSIDKFTLLLYALYDEL